MDGLGGTEDQSGVFTPKLGELPFVEGPLDPLVGVGRRSDRVVGSAFGLEIGSRPDMLMSTHQPRRSDAQ